MVRKPPTPSRREQAALMRLVVGQRLFPGLRVVGTWSDKGTLSALCPLHEDTHHSAFVFANGRGGGLHCRACYATCDVFDLGQLTGYGVTRQDVFHRFKTTGLLRKDHGIPRPPLSARDLFVEWLDQDGKQHDAEQAKLVAKIARLESEVRTLRQRLDGSKESYREKLSASIEAKAEKMLVSARRGFYRAVRERLTGHETVEDADAHPSLAYRMFKLLDADLEKHERPENGRPWSVRRFMTELGPTVKERSVKRALSELKDAGFVRVVKRNGGRGFDGFQANHLNLRRPTLEQCRGYFRTLPQTLELAS
jgi:hypothetical protein